MLLCVFGYLHCQVTYFTIFIVKQPPSVETTRGVFLSPETFPRKIFPKFFQIHPKRLFADFLARICDEGNGCLLPAYGGGTRFLWACGLVAGLLRIFFPFPSLLRLCRRSGSLFLVGLSCWCWASLVPSLPFFLPSVLVGFLIG